MHWLKRGLWKAGITIAGMVLTLLLITWVPLSVANAHQGTSELATPSTVIVQATPTEDGTVTALNKEKLKQEVEQLKEQNDATVIASNEEKRQHENDWWWNYGATILTALISTFTLAAAGVFTVVRYFNDRADTRTKQDEEQQRWLKDQEAEREKRAEERFQAAVEGLSSEREEAKIGAAILLRTFLRPGYEQFYRQTFDLVVANLRLPRTPHPPEDPDNAQPLTTLSQALMGAFKEAFPLARSQNQGGPPSLDAGRIQLDNAYLRVADLKQVWMSDASLRKADLREVQLDEAQLNRVNLSKAKLGGAHLNRAKLRRAKFKGTDLGGADLSGADLTAANLEDAFSLQATDLRGVKGLTKKQLVACKAKGAIVDEDSTISASQSTFSPPPPSKSSDIQAS